MSDIQRHLKFVLPDYNPKYAPSPKGEMLLVQVPIIEETTASNLLLPGDARRGEQAILNIGYVVSMGEEAYKHNNYRTPLADGAWCKAGDWVLIAPNNGHNIEVVDDAGECVKFKLIHCSHVLAVTEHPNRTSTWN